MNSLSVFLYLFESESVNFAKNVAENSYIKGQVIPLCVDIDTLEVYVVDSNNQPLDNKRKEVLIHIEWIF
jgi:hypothetical protein